MEDEAKIHFLPDGQVLFEYDEMTPDLLRMIYETGKTGLEPETQYCKFGVPPQQEAE